MTEPTRDEVNRVLAEKVMGWKVEEHPEEKGVQGCDGFCVVGDGMRNWKWNPFGNVEQAFQCWVKLLSFGKFCCADIR